MVLWILFFDLVLLLCCLRVATTGKSGLLRWRSASFYLAANVNSAAAAGGFNRRLLLQSFMFRYSQWVVQEGEVVANSSSAPCG